MGPIPFLLYYVNDLPQHIADGRFSMYANNTILYCNGNDIHVTDNLQQCLNSAGEWYLANRLVLKTGIIGVNSYYSKLDCSVSAPSSSSFSYFCRHPPILPRYS